MKQPTTITINDHKIRTIHRDNQTWYVRADVRKAIGNIDITGLSRSEKNAIPGSQVNEPSQTLMTIISESGLRKLVPPEELPITRSAEENMWIIRLAEIDMRFPDMVPGILAEVMRIKMGEMSISDIVIGLMCEIRDLKQDHPGYKKAMDHINRTYANLFPDTPALTFPNIYAQMEGL